MPRNRTPLFLIISTLIIGFFLLVSSILVEFWYRSVLPEIAKAFLHIFFEIGVAFIVAGVVASIFEWVLAEHRQNEIKNLIERDNEIKHFGFEKIYANRQEVFDKIFSDALPHVRNEVRIIGICVSLFKEADRRPSGRPLNSQGLVDLIVSLVGKE